VAGDEGSPVGPGSPVPPVGVSAVPFSAELGYQLFLVFLQGCSEDLVVEVGLVQLSGQA